jgi:sentrin-specific protease 1
LTDVKFLRYVDTNVNVEFLMFPVKVLRSYLDSEHRNKRKEPFDFTGWQDHNPEDTPQQENGYDCGIFTCLFLEALSRGEETFDFSQGDMAYFRRRMIWEIGHAKFLDDP